MEHNINAIDKAAMATSATLMLLGIVVLGIVEVLAGPPYSPIPLENEAGEIVAMPLFGPNIRTGLVVLGLAVLLLWGLYRLASPEFAGERAPRPESTAD